MYHAIIRSKVRDVFNALNRGDYALVMSSLAPAFEHWFIGDHALAGLRTSALITQEWYQRLYKIFPDLRFDLNRVVSQGTPWDTTVTIEWRDHFALHNGKQGSNCGVHIIHFRWAKADSVRIYCDTKLLLENLAIQAEGGIREAELPPLIG